jgi:hypothetical protein
LRTNHVIYFQSFKVDLNDFTKSSPSRPQYKSIYCQ